MDNKAYEDKDVLYASLAFEPKPGANWRSNSTTALAIAKFKKSITKPPVHRYICDQSIQTELDKNRKFIKQAASIVFLCFAMALNISMWPIAHNINSSTVLLCGKLVFIYFDVYMYEYIFFYFTLKIKVIG